MGDSKDSKLDLNYSDLLDMIDGQTSPPGEEQPATGGSVFTMEPRVKPFVRILEQPASNMIRFRYAVEGRLAGSIPGVHSTSDNKTYPTIKIEGYQGRAIVVVSCVTKNLPHYPHPHSIVGTDRPAEKKSFKHGVCTVEFQNPEMKCSLSNLGIQCVKKKEIPQALEQRKRIKVDPFNCGGETQGNYDMGVIRLAFQVFLEGPTPGKFRIPLKPVASDPIHDKKASQDLKICKLSDCTSPASGGKEIILLCEKVVIGDIGVRFFEDQNGELLWEAWGAFAPSDIHKQAAISFRTPRYRITEILDPVAVYVELVRPSDGATSEPRRFQYLPSILDVQVMNKKRKLSLTLLGDLGLLEGNCTPRPVPDFGCASPAQLVDPASRLSIRPTSVRFKEEPQGKIVDCGTADAGITYGALDNQFLYVPTDGPNDCARSSNLRDNLPVTIQVRPPSPDTRTQRSISSPYPDQDSYRTATRRSMSSPTHFHGQDPYGTTSGSGAASPYMLHQPVATLNQHCERSRSPDDLLLYQDQTNKMAGATSDYLLPPVNTFRPTAELIPQSAGSNCSRSVSPNPSTYHTGQRSGSESSYVLQPMENLQPYGHYRDPATPRSVSPNPFHNPNQYSNISSPASPGNYATTSTTRSHPVNGRDIFAEACGQLFPFDEIASDSLSGLTMEDIRDSVIVNDKP